MPETKLFKGIKKLDLKGRTDSFLELGRRLRNLPPKVENDIFERAGYQNPWFSVDSIKMAFEGLINYLDSAKLEVWLDQYDLTNVQPHKVGVVMAGNIPMVGIHDLICVLLSGHQLVVKLSSQDEVLIKFIIDQLIRINNEFKSQVIIADRLKDVEAVIATGSDNTARYFHYYFDKIPHIIRKNRTSVALLNGDESADHKKALATDIFTYYGLGCRNVSKLLLPSQYDVTSLFEHWNDFEGIADHHKYYNNYQYQKSIMLINQVPHLDSGYVLMQQNDQLVSPIGVIYYDFYDTLEEAKNHLGANKDKIQCVVTQEAIGGKIEFGKAQMPDINDFADNIDTMKFLSVL